MTRSPGSPSVLSVALGAVVGAPLLAAALAGVLAPAPAGAAVAQVTGEAEAELRLAPAEHGRLIDPLVTEEERAEWHSLVDPAAREAFLERFWSRRDPTPGTPENEVRDLFMRRAARAASLYGEEGTPGWATPRGRVLLVYGLPDEQERRATGQEPELRWTWSDAPGALTVRFSPAAGDSWTLREESAPELDWEAFAANARRHLRLPVQRGGPAPTEDPEAAVAGADAGAGEEAGEVAPPPMPPETVAWLRMVRDGEVRRDFPMQHRVYFFPGPDGTYVLVGFVAETESLTFEPVTAEATEEDAEGGEESAADGETDDGDPGEPPAEAPVAGSPDDEDDDREAAVAAAEDAPEADQERARLRAFGGILGAPEGEPQIVHQFNIPFTVTRPRVVAADPGTASGAEGAGETPTGPDGFDDADGTGVRSFGVTLTPGTYRLAWGLLDAGSDRMTMADQVIRVPRYGGDSLQLSSVILARPPHSEAEAAMSVADVYGGLRLGSSLLDGAIDRVLDRDERFEVVFLVDGWQEDEAAPGRPRLEVGYRILVVEADGSRASIARLPVQELTFHAVGQEIPLSQIRQIEPGGSYELEISVRDLVADTQVVEIVPFSVAAEEGDAEDG